MANRSDREQGQPTQCRRRHSLLSRMGPCSRTPSGPAVSTDCMNRPDRRLHPTNATASIFALQRGSHPQKTFLVYLPRTILVATRITTKEEDVCGRTRCSAGRGGLLDPLHCVHL